MSGRFHTINQGHRWSLSPHGWIVYPKHDAAPNGVYFPNEPAFDWPTTHPYPPPVEPGDPPFVLPDYRQNLASLKGRLDPETGVYTYALKDRVFLQSGNQFFFPRRWVLADPTVAGSVDHWATTGEVYSWWGSPAGDGALTSYVNLAYTATAAVTGDGEAGNQWDELVELGYYDGEGTFRVHPLTIYKNGYSLFQLTGRQYVYISGFGIKRLDYLNAAGVACQTTVYLVGITALHTQHTWIEAYVLVEKELVFLNTVEVFTREFPNNTLFFPLFWPLRFSHSGNTFAMINSGATVADDAATDYLEQTQGTLSYTIGATPESATVSATITRTRFLGSHIIGSISQSYHTVVPKPGLPSGEVRDRYLKSATAAPVTYPIGVNFDADNALQWAWLTIERVEDRIQIDKDVTRMGTQDNNNPSIEEYEATSAYLNLNTLKMHYVLTIGDLVIPFDNDQETRIDEEGSDSFYDYEEWFVEHPHWIAQTDREYAVSQTQTVTDPNGKRWYLAYLNVAQRTLAGFFYDQQPAPNTSGGSRTLSVHLKQTIDDGFTQYDLSHLYADSAGSGRTYRADFVIYVNGVKLNRETRIEDTCTSTTQTSASPEFEPLSFNRDIQINDTLRVIMDGETTTASTWTAYQTTYDAPSELYTTVTSFPGGSQTSSSSERPPTTHFNDQITGSEDRDLTSTTALDYYAMDYQLAWLFFQPPQLNFFFSLTCVNPQNQAVIPAFTMVMDERHRPERGEIVTWMYSWFLRAKAVHAPVSLRFDRDETCTQDGLMQTLTFKPNDDSGRFGEFAAPTLSLHPIGLY